jgi:hypothetical protein
MKTAAARCRPTNGWPFFRGNSGFWSLILALAAGAAHADPGVSFSPSSLGFGNGLVGQWSPAQTLTLTNTGASLLTINSISFTGSNPGDFAISSDSSEANLAPGASRTLGIHFKAGATGARSATLAVSDNASGSPHLVSLNGNGVMTFVYRYPSSYNFGTITAGQASPWQPITIRNDGNTALRISRVDTGYTDPQGWFWVDRSGCPMNTDIPPGGTGTVAVSFHPGGAASRSATLYIYDNALFSPHLVPLLGTGVLPALAPAAPSNLAVQFLIGDPTYTHQFTWTDNSNNETGFELQARPVGGTWSGFNWSTVGANITSTKTYGWAWGRTYEVRVRAVNQVGPSAWSDVLTFVLKDPFIAPDNLKAIGGTGTQVDISWEDSTGNALRYEIWRTVDADPMQPLATTPGNSLTFTDRGLQPGIHYGYIVRAIRPEGPSKWSNWAYASVTGVPRRPTGLSVQFGAMTQLNLVWTDASDNETGFEIQRMPPGGAWATVTTVPANTTRYSDTSVAPLATYIYRLRAASSYGPSDWSNEAVGATVDPPAAPTGLTASGTTYGKGALVVYLRWQDNSSNETAFALFRKDSSGIWSQIGVVAANTTVYYDGGVAPNTTYSYRMRANNNTGASAWSNEVTVTTPTAPNAPANLTATGVVGGIKLTWTDNNSPTVESFEIWRKPGWQPGTDWFLFKKINPITTVADYSDGMIPGVVYTYRVRALRFGLYSDWSNEASAIIGTGP